MARTTVATDPSGAVGTYATGWRLAAILGALLLINVLSQVDRILPFILAESIKRDLGLSDTQIGLLTGLAFAVCYALLSLPLARAADRGSPRLVLVSCIVIWSAMTALGGLAASFLFLALTRFGVAFGEAGAIPAGHALIARRVRPERRGLAIGLFSMGIPLGTMVGFAVGGIVDQHLGWRAALVGAGAIGVVIALLALVVTGPTPPRARAETEAQPFLRSSLTLLSAPGFRWLFIASIAMGFAAAPFYAFAASFLIRTHGFTTGEAGLVFGLLQGLMGLLGAVAGGRGFDRAARSETGRLLAAPAILFLIAGATTAIGLFTQTAWLSVALLVPAMLSFAFLLPWGFGAAHLVAGRGREALASSLLVIGTGLLGPALGPLMVGVISDLATNGGLTNGLSFGLLVVPAASVLAGLAFLVADRAVATALQTSSSGDAAPTTDGATP